MKTHTSSFKNAIKEYGREIDSVITYTSDGSTIELGNEELNSITPSFEGSILKSVMKQLIIDSNVEIPVNTELNFQFGVKIADEDVEDYRDNYEYVDFGNYIVKEVEKSENTSSYTIKCYDKMLYAMQEYQQLDITYPITIRNYINAIATELGLTFKNASDTFANYDKEIQNELFLSKETRTIEEEGEEPREEDFYVSLGYTYRDVLDQLAQVTASTICINEEDDELEIRYINDTGDTINEEYLKDVNVNFGEKYGVVNSIVLSRSGDSDNVYLQDEESIEENGLCEIKISDNQIMNFEDREDYLEDILEELDGLEYYINDFSSTGICYYNVCDKYSISRDGTTYDCIMFNNEINITQGLEENIHTDMPEYSETDYTKADKSDITMNKTMLLVDKQNNEINALVQSVETQGDNLSTLTNRVEQNITSTQANITAIQEIQENGVTKIQNSSLTLDLNGLHINKSDSNLETFIDDDEFSIWQGGAPDGIKIAYFGYDKDEQVSKAEMDNLTVPNYFVTGYHRLEKFDIDGEQHTGVFYIGE